MAGALALVFALLPGAGMSGTVAIHADRPFYVERPEPETRVTGWLRAGPVVTGPDTRDLPLQLETVEGALPVYALGVALEALRPFIDEHVTLDGKRVDLRAEGGTVEFWPARAQLAPP